MTFLRFLRKFRLKVQRILSIIAVITRNFIVL